jgi:hypothetical protein
MSRQLFHTPNVTKYFYNKVTKYYYNGVYSSLRIFSAALFNNLSTTSSIIEFARLITSNASFISGSARGLYGSGSGDSSAVIDKLLVRSHKATTKVKIQKNTYAPFALSNLFGSPSFFSGVVGVFFILFYNFMGQFLATFHPDIRIKFSAHQSRFG